MVGASGFSHSTGFPTSRQASTSVPWVWSGEATRTASTLLSRIRSSGSAKARAGLAGLDDPAPLAPASGSDTATSSTPDTALDRIRAWSVPITPAPISPTPIVIEFPINRSG